MFYAQYIVALSLRVPL